MGDTILQYFFLMQGVLDKPGTIGWLDIGQHFTLTAVSDDATLEFDFIKVTVTDDVSYFAPVNTVYNYTFPSLVTDSTQIPTVLAVCNNTNGAILPRYSHLFWDPTLSALFTQDPSDPASSSGVNKTAAIAAGVSVGAVLLIVVAIVVIYITVWAPRKNRLSRKPLTQASQIQGSTE